MSALFHDARLIALCFGLGAVCILLAVRHAHAAWRGPRDTPVERPFAKTMTRALRALLTGLCLMGLGYGLHTGSMGWTVASIAIGLEELYECTMALSVLGWCERVAAEDEGRVPVVG